MKNIMSVSSHNTSAYFHRTTLLLISLVIVLPFSFSVCLKKLRWKKSDLSWSFSMSYSVLDALDINDGVHE